MAKRKLKSQRPPPPDQLRAVRSQAPGERPDKAFGSGWQRLSGQARVWLTSLGLAALVFAVFAPSLRCDFVSYDDPDFVTENPHVRTGLSWANLHWALGSDPQTSYWAPLTTLSHQLTCQVFGLHAWGHHLVNILLHAVNAALVFVVFQQMTGARWRSL
jgi:protein O-mannosyl-transferase